MKNRKEGTYLCENFLRKSGVSKIKTQNYYNKVRQISSYVNLVKVG